MKTQHHKTFRIAAALALTGLLSGHAFARVDQNNATADVTVRLIQPISIEKLEDLNFGAFITGGNDQVILAPSSVLNANGREMSSIGNPPKAALFAVTGEPYLSYSLSGARETVLLQNENGDSLGVNLYATNVSGASDIGGVLSDLGFDLIYVGGFFDINDHARGIYTAPAGISLTVNYN